MDMHNAAGTVYKLSEHDIIVYDHEGIALRLSERLLAQIAQSLVEGKQVKFQDRKERRFTVSTKGENILFDIVGNASVEVVGELLFPLEQMAA